MPVLRPTTCLGWHPALAVVLAIAFQSALSESAEASCGDWLAHDSMPAEQQEPAESEPAREMPSPCSSGECRRAPDVPLPGSPQRSLTPQPDQWGALADLDLRLSSPGDRFALEVPLHFPDGGNARLERPPRG